MKFKAEGIVVRGNQFVIPHELSFTNEKNFGITVIPFLRVTFGFTVQ